MRVRLCLMFFALGILGVTSAAAQEAPGSTGETDHPAPPQSSAELTTRIRVGGNVISANIAHMVSPVYPPIAKTAHISGTVILHCIIGTDGTMKAVSYVSGPPLLMKAAMDAAHQWTYKPTLLNGRAVEVDTTVSVVFTLGDDPSVDPQHQDTSPSTSPSPGSEAAAGPASSSSTAAAAAIDPKLRADIQHLLNLTHLQEKQEEAMRQILGSMRPELRATLPVTPNREKILDTYTDRLVGLMQSEDFRNRLAVLYAQYLTDDDVKAAITFYETAAGQHYLESSIKLVPEIMMAGQHMAKDAVPAILHDLCKEYPELNGDQKFCGSTDPTRKSQLLSANPSPLGN